MVADGSLTACRTSEGPQIRDSRDFSYCRAKPVGRRLDISDFSGVAFMDRGSVFCPEVARFYPFASFAPRWKSRLRL